MKNKKISGLLKTDKLSRRDFIKGPEAQEIKERLNKQDCCKYSGRQLLNTKLFIKIFIVSIFLITVSCADDGSSSAHDEDNNDNPAIVTSHSFLFTGESGQGDMFTVMLDSQPLEDVVITLLNSDPTEGELSVDELTFTSDNWDESQIVTLFGVDDIIADGSIQYLVDITSESVDPDFDELIIPSVFAINADNDTAGFIVNKTQLDTDESGKSDSFLLNLSAEPVFDVTVNISSSDNSEGAVSPVSIIFTSENWNIPVSVTITGTSDNQGDGDINYHVDIESTSDDEAYNNISHMPIYALNKDSGFVRMVGDNHPYNFIIFNDLLFYYGNSSSYGKELWVSDGTTEGTSMVRNIRSSGDSWIFNFTIFNDALYFTAMTSSSSDGIYVTDGTRDGTQLVVDVNPIGRARPGNLTVMDDHLYFTATNGTDGEELWRTDGIEAGTEMFEINTTVDLPADSPGDSSPDELTLYRGNLYFSANDGTGIELWKMDGSAPEIVVDLNDVSANGTNPRDLFVFKDRIYFYVSIQEESDTFSHWEIYSTRGYESSTEMYPGSENSWAQYCTVYNEEMYFRGYENQSIGYEFYKLNGTDPMERVRDINENMDLGIYTTSSYPNTFVVYNNKLYFSANDESHGQELWSTDGTLEGTQMLKDIYSGEGSALGEYASKKYLVIYRDELYFAADDGEHGRELWKTDGTREGTVIAKDLVAGPDGSSPTSLCVYKDELFFNAKSSGSSYNGSLWKYSPGE